MPPRKYASARAFKVALGDRLNKRAKAQGVPKARLLRFVSFDRLLARLLEPIDPMLVLKGGYAMELRMEKARTTKDVDLSLPSIETVGKGGNSDLHERLRKRAKRDVGDYLTFDIAPSKMNLQGAPYGGGRFPDMARLDGRLFASFHLDVGTSDAVTSDHEEVDGEDWLAFAGIPPARIRMISKDQQFAEKIHAYTLRGEGYGANSRVKDLVDLVLLINTEQLDQQLAKEAVDATFSRRNTHEYPKTLPDPPNDWGDRYGSLAQECEIDPNVGAGVGVPGGATR